MNTLKEKQDEELERFLSWSEFGINVEEREELKRILDKVRKETAECVCDRMIKEISDLRKAETSDEEEKIWNFGYDWRIKEEKELKKQIIKEL